MKYIDTFLNRITMYRLVLYYLILLYVASLILSVFGLLPYTPLSLLVSGFILFLSGYCSNKVFSIAFQASPNFESVYITSLILCVVVPPTTSVSGITLLIWFGVLANASKYIFAINKKHIFNPVAIALVISYFMLGETATWWVGRLYLLPIVTVGGFLIVRKVRRASLVLTFFVFFLGTLFVLSHTKGLNPMQIIERTVFLSPLVFFGTIMLTEPLTSPPTRIMQIFYGAIVGVLFTPQLHFGSLYITPEIALVIGNIFAFFVSPQGRLVLPLKEKHQWGSSITDFVFPRPAWFHYKPGQYMEWTLSHKSPDSRGNRRYFTLASSPTEDFLHLGVRFSETSSSFKRKLMSLVPGEKVIASQLAGEFTLPKDPQRKVVFVAGGIGVTPFRSMVKYLLDKQEKREVVMFYSNKVESEIAYKDIFDEASSKLNMKVLYVLTDTELAPEGWSGKLGRIDADMIRREVSDYKERLFYISGPHTMVEGFKATLRELGVSRRNIKVDFFPGFV